jgi:hypothetical protein
MSGVFAANQNAVQNAAMSWLSVPLKQLGLGPDLEVPLYVGVNELWGSLANHAGVDVISADRATRLDSIIMKAAFTAGTKPIAPGTEIYLHVYSIGYRYQYYDDWYHVIVGQNQPVHRLRPGLNAPSAPAPIGQFDEEDYGRLFLFSTRGAWYWRTTQAFLLQWRSDITDKTQFKFSVQNPEGVSIRTATGSTAAPGTPDLAGADFSATSSRFTIRLTIDLTDEGQVYGQPMLFIGPPPDYDWRVGYLVVWISFNNTRVGSDYLTSNGWTLLNQDLTPGYMNFYRVILPISGSLTSVGSATIDISIDTGSLESRTAVSLRIWVADLQVPADAAAGKDNAAPTPSSSVAGYGIGSTIFANGFQVVSGRPTHQLVWAVFKTG